MKLGGKIPFTKQLKKIRIFENKIQFLNDYKIGTKLIIIFVGCVLLPLVVTNTVVITLLSEQARQEQLQNMKKQLEVEEYSIDSVMDEAVAAMKNVYVDWSINKFLEERYIRPSDYFDAYNELLDKASLQYFYRTQIVKNITIYADNSTINDGGNVGKISNVEDTEWYQKFKAQESEVMVYVSYVESKKYVLPNVARIVSVIRKLNYYGDNGIEKILKVDFNYNEVARQLAFSQVQGQVYTCNEDYILFYNKEENVANREFTPASTLNLDDAIASREVSVFEQTWTIYAFDDSISFFDSLTGIGPIAIILIAINLFLPTVTLLLIGKSISSRIVLTQEHLKKVKQGQYELIEANPGKDEIGGLINNYNRMVAKVKELIDVVFKEKVEKQELELSKKEAELVALHSQINPHFMFNTLESIRMRSLIKGEEETAEAIGQMAILMRRTIYWGSDMITIREELEFTQAYLFLQKYRFGDKLSFWFHVKEECLPIRIPKLTIVTFVENSCVHGIEKISHPGDVSITISANTEFLFVEISDNGYGIAEKQLAQIHEKMQNANVSMLSEAENVGILNACIRLKSATSNRTIFEISSQEGKGTDITLQIPLEELEGCEELMEKVDEEND